MKSPRSRAFNTIKYLSLRNSFMIVGPRDFKLRCLKGGIGMSRMVNRSKRTVLSVLLVFAFMVTFIAFPAVSYASPPIVRTDYAPGKYYNSGPYSYSTYQLPGWRHGATVYYPTDAAAPYSGIVFCPPYTGTQIMFRDWGPFFASHGIVLVTMDTSTTLITVDQRAPEQRTVLDLLKAENSRANSPLYEKLDTERVGATGWSMGGGATWINSAEYTGLKTAMSLAGHNLTAINPNSSGRNTQCPTIIFCGRLDTTYLGGLGQSEGVYYSIPSGIPKVYYEAGTAGHFDWGGPTDANRHVAELALAFQKTFLDGDDRWEGFIEEPRFDYLSTFRSRNINN